MSNSEHYWQAEQRDAAWSNLDQAWDIIVVGGGITGAGIVREAARMGLKALLVEQRDFAWGTSSRSSKLVHGGLRYLREGRVRTTIDSVREREHLLKEGQGLVKPLGFLLASYAGERAGRITYGAGLSLYDLLALRWSHTYHSAEEFRLLAGQIEREGLRGGYHYGDAQTDDARLVLRILQEAMADGATVLNYARAEKLLRDAGMVCGLELIDCLSERKCEVYAPVVVNATGAWADHLREQVEGEAKIRPLRGSHLIFPQSRLPMAEAVSFLHPADQRSVFVLPWEGVALVGTTDEDCEAPLDQEPAISPDEVAYLMAAVEARYPSFGLSLDNVIATFAGIRPVIGSGKVNPSDESRDHAVWEEDGLITVTGGKLTTFRLIALDVLKAMSPHLPDMPAIDAEHPVLDPVSEELLAGTSLDDEACQRLLGRYGAAAPALVAAAEPGELTPVAETPVLWAELRWAARAEAVVHLDDLLLRRVRLGLLLPEGGHAELPRIREICQAELGWDEARWEAEEAAYLRLWRQSYSLPPRESIPDWRAQLTAVREKRQEKLARRRERRARRRRRGAVAAAIALVLGLVIVFFWRRDNLAKAQ